MAQENPEQVVGLKIPDDEVRGWMELFRKAGFSGEEIDSMMVKLNDEFAHQKLKDDIAGELAWFDTIMQQQKGRPMTEEERSELTGALLDQVRKNTESK